MDASTGSSFFIAGKLRGIPLVTGGTRSLDRQDESSTRSDYDYNREHHMASSTGLDMQPVTSISLMKLIHTTRQPTTTTATTKSIKSRKTTTTTTVATPVKKKPKPATTTTTTTTKKPQINRSRLVPVSSGGRNVGASGATSTMQHQRANGLLANAILQSGIASRPSSDITKTQNVSNRMVDAGSVLGRKLDLTNLELMPVNQRRAQQSIMARFINKPNEKSAGENWKLFNRSDGQTSIFEGVAVGANVMIVSTIVLVIIVNWIKALRRKQRTITAKSEQGQSPVGSSGSAQQPIQSPLQSLNGVKSPNDRLGRMLDGASDATRSAVGSAASSALSNLVNVTSSAGQEKKNGDAPKAGPSFSNQGMDQVGSAQKLSSEIKGGSAMASKAMAIVQPSENMDMRNSADKAKVPIDKLDEELLKKPESQIHRSVSDLSGGSGLNRGPLAKAVLDDINKEVNDKVNQLNELFKGSAPNLNTIESIKADAKKMLEPLVSANSLESVELPTDLVANIKQAENKDVAPEAPSPNLLLGEVEPPKERPSDRAEVKKPDGKQTGKTVSGKAASGQKEADDKLKSQKKHNAAEKRPENPMGRQIEDNAKAASKTAADAQIIVPSAKAAEVKSHQVVVNKLDKRKTNLEIVDLRDESVTGKMRAQNDFGGTGDKPSDKLVEDQGWISMDGVAVVQAAPPAQLSAANQQFTTTASGTQTADQVMSPSEIIDSRFNVDYAGQRRRASAMKREGSGATKDSMDSKAEEQILNNIENELELNNDRLRNRKYFVYIVNDGHFTAKKECIARIELPPKRRITLAEMRQLITNSKDISLLSLRRNKFKFVTETYRLLNENEDATVLHQVYPTQGVFLKLNVAESESQAFVYKGRNRGSSNANVGSNTLAQTTIASRRRANARGASGDNLLPAIEVEPADGFGGLSTQRSRAASVGRRAAGQRQPVGNRSAGSYGRSKSNIHTRGGAQQRRKVNNSDALPSIGRLQNKSAPERQTEKRVNRPVQRTPTKRPSNQQVATDSVETLAKLGNVATDLGANVLSGAKKLFNSLR